MKPLKPQIARFLCFVGSAGFLLAFVYTFALFMLFILRLYADFPAGYGTPDEYVDWFLWLSFLLIALGLFGLEIRFGSKVHLVTGVFSLFVFLISVPSVLFFSLGLLQFNSTYTAVLEFYSPILGIALWGASLNLVATTRKQQSKTCYAASVLLMIASPSGVNLFRRVAYYFYFTGFLLFPLLAPGAMLAAYVMYKIAREKATEQQN